MKQIQKEVITIIDYYKDPINRVLSMPLGPIVYKVYLGLVVYSSKEDSKGKPIRHKKLDNSKTKSSKYNKWP